jgi:hypothetical protein
VLIMEFPGFHGHPGNSSQALEEIADANFIGAVEASGAPIAGAGTIEDRPFKLLVPSRHWPRWARSGNRAPLPDSPRAPFPRGKQGHCAPKGRPIPSCRSCRRRWAGPSRYPGISHAPKSSGAGASATKSGASSRNGSSTWGGGRAG